MVQLGLWREDEIDGQMKTFCDEGFIAWNEPGYDDFSRQDYLEYVNTNERITACPSFFVMREMDGWKDCYDRTPEEEQEVLSLMER